MNLEIQNGSIPVWVHGYGPIMKSGIPLAFSKILDTVPSELLTFTQSSECTPSCWPNCIPSYRSITFIPYHERMSLREIVYFQHFVSITLERLQIFTTSIQPIFSALTKFSNEIHTQLLSWMNALNGLNSSSPCRTVGQSQRERISRNTRLGVYGSTNTRSRKYITNMLASLCKN